jgi:hypothetical protein
MKATLTFTLPEENEEFNMAVKAGSYHGALWDVSQNVFRPYRKHGYPDMDMQALFEEIDVATDGKGSDFMEKLEALFWAQLNDHDVNLG